MKWHNVKLFFLFGFVLVNASMGAEPATNALFESIAQLGKEIVNEDVNVGNQETLCLKLMVYDGSRPTINHYSDKLLIDSESGAFRYEFRERVAAGAREDVEKHFLTEGVLDWSGEEMTIYHPGQDEWFRVNPDSSVLLVALKRLGMFMDLWFYDSAPDLGGYRAAAQAQIDILKQQQGKENVIQHLEAIAAERSIPDESGELHFIEFKKGEAQVFYEVFPSGVVKSMKKSRGEELVRELLITTEVHSKVEHFSDLPKSLFRTELYEELGFKVDRDTLLVLSVTKNSKADMAGIAPGWIIIRLNGLESGQSPNEAFVKELIGSKELNLTFAAENNLAKEVQLIRDY